MGELIAALSSFGIVLELWNDVNESLPNGDYGLCQYNPFRTTFDVWSCAQSTVSKTRPPNLDSLVKWHTQTFAHGKGA